MAADRVARPRGAGRGAQRRRQGGLRRGRAARRGSAGRGATRARTTGSRRRWSRCAGRARSASCRAARTSASAAAARCSICTSAAQVATKQRALEDALWHLGKVRPERVLRPIEGPAWGYRQRARLSVRYVVKKGTVLVGFHERKSSFVADIASCDGAAAHVSDLLLPLRALVGAMATRDRLPQIELAVGDGVHGARAAPPRAARRRRPRRAARLRRASTASSGGCSRRGRTRRGCSTAAAPALAYALPEFGVTHAVPADRLHAGQPRRSTACSSARALRLLDAAAGRARRSTGSAASAISRCRWRRAPRRCSASRAARRWSSARARTPRLNGLARKATLRRAQPVRDDAPTSWSRSARPTGGWSTRRAKARSRSSRRWPSCKAADRAGAGGRRSASSTSAATRRRWRATPGCWCTAPATAARRPARSTCSRTRRTSRASPSSTLTRKAKRGPEGPRLAMSSEALASVAVCRRRSRGSSSSVWNTLYRSR